MRPSQSLTVNMTLDHQRDGDLFIEIIAPNGNATVLYEKPNDNGVNFVNTTFSDTAPTVDCQRHRPLLESEWLSAAATARQSQRQPGERRLHTRDRRF